MSLEEYKGVYVFAQQVDGEVSGIAYELLGKAKDLAKDLNTDVTAVLIGYNVKGLVDGLAQYGADKVIVVDDKELEVYRTEPYTHALASVINEYKPEIVLVGATAIGRDLGPRVSARVATGLTADCTVLEIGDFNDIASKQVMNTSAVLMTRPAFGGNTIATIACPYQPSTDGNCSSGRYAEDRSDQRCKSRSDRVTILDLLQTTNMLRFWKLLNLLVIQ